MDPLIMHLPVALTDEEVQTRATEAADLSLAMRWLSIDPATSTGIAFWVGSELVGVGTLLPITTAKRAIAVGAAKGGLELRMVPGGSVVSAAYATPWHAWAALLSGVGHVVIEEAMGRFAKAVAQLAERRGYIRAMCDVSGVSYSAINSAEWKRVAGEDVGRSWPAAHEPSKQLSIDLTAAHYGGLVVSDDEGDAIWLGRAALRLWTVRP